MNYLEINPDELASHLSDLYGLPLRTEGKKLRDNYSIILCPEGNSRTETFSIEISPGYTRYKFAFIPGNFAADLINQMGSAEPDRKKMTARWAAEIVHHDGQVIITINGKNVSPDRIETWPDQWKQLYIEVKSERIDTLDTSEALLYFPDAYSTVLRWAGYLIGLIFPLLPLEEADHLYHQGEIEGNEFEYSGTRYERSRVNRAICIAAHGTRCKVCNFSFEEVYGPIGRAYIHVHHTTPISELGGEYVDPVKDLVPLCPNCHAMAHTRKPPYTIEELKQFLNRQSNS